MHDFLVSLIAFPPFFAETFILHGLLAGLLVSLMAGPMGCFVVWRRMAYFGESLSHSALLGLGLGLLFGLNLNIAVFIVCFLFASLLTYLRERRILAIDTLLGILAHASLAAGLLLISFMELPAYTLTSYLFGDILLIQNSDLWLLGAASIIVLTLLLYNWSSFILISINKELAQAEGLPVYAMELLFMFLITVVVATSIRFVGILLITSMLIIPAAGARQISKSPKMMALLSIALSMMATLAGFSLSILYDLATAPAIVVCATLLFALLTFVGKLKLKLLR